ncbi:MAG: FHA domain-containing protein [Verrucomicrobiota bacterium]
MARLFIQSESVQKRPLDLRLGLNRVGRHPDCDFQIEHDTISSQHCELHLSADGVFLRDCDSTNGTFVNREPVKEVWLQPGQTVHLGEIALLVETIEITIAIPKPHKFPPVGVGSPVVMPAGALVCSRHPAVLASYKCTNCEDLICSKCIRSIKRQGGQALFFCPNCSEKCVRVNTGGPKKKTFIETLRATVKLPFTVLSERIHPKK